MNRKGSFFGKTFVTILTIGLILILLLSLGYSIYSGISSAVKSPSAPAINPENITLEELLYKYPAYNFNETDMPVITTIYSNPKYQTETGLNRTLVYKEIEKVFLFRGIWAKTKEVFSGAGGIVTGTFAYIGFANPRVFFDHLYIWPIFFASIIFVFFVAAFKVFRYNVKALIGISVFKSIWMLFKWKKIVYTFWILFGIYLGCLFLPFFKPLLIPLFSDYGIKATQAYQSLGQSLTNITAVFGTFKVQTTKLNAFYLIVIRSFATAAYISFFFIVKEFVKSFYKGTAASRAEIAAQIAEEKQRMKDEQQVAAVKILSNLGKYMAEPTKPD